MLRLTRTPLMLVALSILFVRSVNAATPEEIKREAEGLLQMGKPEQAFISIVQAVKGNPEAAPMLRNLTDQALSEVMKRVAPLRQRSNFYESLRMLGPVWTAMVSDKTAAALFVTPQDYDRKTKELYTVVLECTLGMSRQHLRKRDMVRALQFADYAIALNTQNPDPQAVQLKSQIEAKMKGAPTPTPLSQSLFETGAGVLFVMKTADDDGFSSTADNLNHPEARIGGMNFTACLSFPDVTIPKGAKIKSARLRGYFFKHADWAMPPFETTIHGEATDSGQGVNSKTPLVQTRPKTQQKVKWTLIKPEQGWVESPDISPVIQAIVNRPGWTPGNRLNLILSLGKGTADFTSFEQDPGSAFRLLVEWQ